MGKRKYERAYGLTHEFPNIRVPLLIHTIYYTLALMLFYGLFFLGDWLNLGNREAALLFLFTLVVCSVGTWLMTFFSVATVRNIGLQLKSSSVKNGTAYALTRLAHVTASAFSYSLLRFLEGLWSLKTELSVKFIINAHKDMFDKERHTADKEVYNKLSFWMYLVNSPLRYAKLFPLLKVLSIFVTLMTVIILAFFSYDGGWIVLYGVFTLALLTNIRKTRMLYLQNIHAALLVASFHPIVNKIHNKDPIYVYDMIIPADVRATHILDRDIEPVGSIKELGDGMHKTDNTLHEQQTTPGPAVSPSDKRVIYVRENLAQGYPEDVLVQALRESGNDEETVRKIMMLAKQTRPVQSSSSEQNTFTEHLQANL